MTRNNNSHDLSTFSLRLGLGLVFILFGYDKLPNPTNWILYIPIGFSTFLKESLSLEIYEFFRWQGLLELLIGAQLVCGFLTRLWAMVAMFLLAGIIFVLGLDHIGIRDMGLLFMALALAFSGGGQWSIDSYLGRARKSNDREK